MRKIRADLVGVVLAEGRNYAAGDEIPEGVAIGDHLVEHAEAAGTAENASKTSESKGTAPEAADAKQEPSEDDEDFSDILGDPEPEKKSAPKSGRKPAPKSGRKG